MQRKNGIKILSVVALLVAAIGLTVAFAAMSQTLTIKGTATMNAAEWNVHFENLTFETEGAGKIVKAPTLQENGTYIGDFEVTLSKPGDSVTIYYDVVNAGSLNAKYSDLLINNFSQINSTEATSYEMIKSIYVEADWDGDGITTDEEKFMTLEKGISIYPGTTEDKELLAPGETCQREYIEASFRDTATELPKGNITLKMNLQYIYEQA